MGPGGGQELLALLTSIGYGVLSALVPVANAEAYVIASQVSQLAGAVPVAVGLAVGQSVGKLILFMAVRQGQELWFVRHRSAVVRPVGRWRSRLRAAVATLLGLLGQDRWGLPVVLLAAVVGLPPLYAVALLAGATRMRAVPFVLTVLVGRTVRFVLVATGTHGLHHWLF